MKTHLVAGGAGFLGSHLCDALLARGDRVLAVDNEMTGRTENLAAARDRDRFAYRRVDVNEPFDLDVAVDRVWHLASPASPPDYARHPVETLRAGADATRHLLDLAERSGARFFLASTSEVYGDPEVSPQPESYWGRVNPIGPRSMYDEAKRYAEALTKAYARSRRVETRIARIFNTYGPRMRLDDGRVVPNFIGQALRNEPLTIYGDGKQTRSFCYVDDEVDGLMRLMESAHQGPMNIGNPAEITILEFAEAIQQAMGKELSMVFRPLPGDDPRQRRPDITLARSVLGWEPRVDLAEGLRRTIASFR